MVTRTIKRQQDTRTQIERQTNISAADKNSPSKLCICDTLQRPHTIGKPPVDRRAVAQYQSTRRPTPVNDHMTRGHQTRHSLPRCVLLIWSCPISETHLPHGFCLAQCEKWCFCDNLSTPTRSRSSAHCRREHAHVPARTDAVDAPQPKPVHTVDHPNESFICSCTCEVLSFLSE